jgi:hypothetical protein
LQDVKGLVMQVPAPGGGESIVTRHLLTDRQSGAIREPAPAAVL